MAQFTAGVSGNLTDSLCVFVHTQRTVYSVSGADWHSPLGHSLHTADRLNTAGRPGRVNLSVILPCTQLILSQGFGLVVRQLAGVENDMSSVERIVHYAHDLEQEPPHEIPERKPAAPWPSEGKLEIKSAFLKYRPELPLVLKGLSMTVNGGEKIGIVGR